MVDPIVLNFKKNSFTFIIFLVYLFLKNFNFVLKLFYYLHIDRFNMLISTKVQKLTPSVLILLTRIVLANKSLLAGTVPANKSLLAGTVPANKSLLVRIVPVNNSILSVLNSLLPRVCEPIITTVV